MTVFTHVLRIRMEFITVYYIYIYIPTSLARARAHIHMYKYIHCVLRVWNILYLYVFVQKSLFELHSYIVYMMWSSSLPRGVTPIHRFCCLFYYFSLILFEWSNGAYSIVASGPSNKHSRIARRCGSVGLYGHRLVLLLLLVYPPSVWVSPILS